MKIFIDTAMIEDIREAHAMGILDGVTTNPSLVAATGKTFRKVLEQICEVVKGPVSAEVVSTETDGMMREARELRKIADNIVVKVPLIEAGLRATRQCADEGIPTNVTLCFSPSQAWLAAKAGASYVSPFVGRLDDVSEDGMALIEQILTIYRNYDYSTEVLVASVRNPTHVVRAAMIGADVVTVPLAVIRQLARHPLTDNGLKRFLDDWKKVPQ